MFEQINDWIRLQEEALETIRAQLQQLEARLLALESMPPPPPPPPPEELPPPQANCYVTSGNDTVVVSSMSELEKAVNDAPPGRHVLIAPGTYAGGPATFRGHGAKGAPIVVRPRDGLGTVTINSPRWQMAPGSEWLVISELSMNGPFNQISGAHNRYTRCKFREISTQTLRVERATDLRIDHCDFSDWVSNNITRNCIKFDPNGFDDGTNVRALIDHCYFHDINPTTGVNGCEIISMWALPENMSLPHASVAVVDHCLFQDIHITPTKLEEDELVTIKSGGFAFRFCTIDNVNMTLRFRTCNNTEVRSCWFENARSHCCDVYGENHLVIGNRFVNNDLWVCAGEVLAKQIENREVNLVPRARANSCRIIGNTMVNSALRVGQWTTSAQPKHPAANTNLHGNVGDVVLVPAQQTDTTVNADDEPYVPAVKLTPEDVGLTAADPLCH